MKKKNHTKKEELYVKKCAKQKEKTEDLIFLKIYLV